MARTRATSAVNHHHNITNTTSDPPISVVSLQEQEDNEEVKKPARPLSLSSYGLTPSSSTAPKSPSRSAPISPKPSVDFTKPPMMFGSDPSQLATLQELLDYDRHMLARKSVKRRHHHQYQDSSDSAPTPSTSHGELEMPLIIQKSLEFLMEKGLNAEGKFVVVVTFTVLLVVVVAVVIFFVLLLSLLLLLLLL